MSIKNIFFIDAETVPETDPKKMFINATHSLDELSGKEGFFYKKFYREIHERLESGLIGCEEAIRQVYSEKAALHAEFGKLVSVSIGCQKDNTFYLKTITGKNEKVVLEQFCLAIEKALTLAGHNIIEFDVPFIFRRLLINGLPIPDILNNYNRKPWESPYKDTLKMWGSTQWAYKVSLNLLCEVLDVPTPKGEMTGASVSDVYYGMFDVSSDELIFDKEDAALKAIGVYNAGDVIADANVYSRMIGLPLIDPTTIKNV